MANGRGFILYHSVDLCGVCISLEYRHFQTLKRLTELSCLESSRHFGVSLLGVETMDHFHVLDNKKMSYSYFDPV